MASKPVQRVELALGCGRPTQPGVVEVQDEMDATRLKGWDPFRLAPRAPGLPAINVTLKNRKVLVKITQLEINNHFVKYGTNNKMIICGDVNNKLLTSV